MNELKMIKKQQMDGYDSIHILSSTKKKKRDEKAKARRYAEEEVEQIEENAIFFSQRISN